MTKTIIAFFIYAMIPVYSFAFSLKSESNMRDAGTSTEMKQDSFSDTTLMETELKKELSGKYEGVLEVSYCCENYEYKNGSVYIDLTVDPIVFIYSGVIGNQYFYENTKIFSKSDDNHENSISGWFEKLMVNGFSGRHLKDMMMKEKKKPDYITKTANLESCKSDIISYFSQEAIFKEYWDNFKQAIINADIYSLSHSVKYPLVDEGFDYANRKTINSASEFYHRIIKYLNESQTSPEIFFNKECHREMEISDGCGGCYIFYGGKFNLVFEKIKGEYKVVRLALWG
ncbi:MAG: hypothetical protein IPG78_06975 [Ignavibacteria bacterium]|nr:hypothetical protein [Ignavibacteria bacterium]